ncbi:SPOR domain-containing protein [Bradyrhizobium sp. LHD-71]|uniref:SPOR domain-containing protein n=1 Tax=Bradyrhizobium sp. LHD-71 TaxID=3072141 RepID=UPI00280F2BE9|nr:SPOR domain-containing protein [Bradyrhizobium sp. LHD-71]MDQ8728813.1 SPOR domain-containing protein [Bradyrhizobium sp. LHD-71]
MADRHQYRPDAVGVRDNHNARSVEGDPLAELARLIGQNDANVAFGRSKRADAPQPAQAPANEPRMDHDPYRDQDQYQEQQDEYQEEAEPAAAEPARPSWMRTAASTGWPRHNVTAAPPAAQEPHYADEQAELYDDTPAFLRNARQHDQARYDHDQSRYDDVLYDQNSQNLQQQYADPQYQDGYQDQPDPNGYPPFYGDFEQEEPKRRRGGLMTVVAVLALAVVGTAGAYGYRSYTGSPRSGEPPVIKAESGANKIVPPTQTADASGKIVDRIGGSANGQERVLSREEQPIDINGRHAPRVVFPPLNQGGSSALPTGTTAPTSSSAPTAQSQVASNGALGDEPKRVRTFAIRPDQPDAVPSQPAAQAQAQPTPAQRTASASSARAQAAAPAANGPMSISPQSDPAPVRTAAVPAAPPPATSGGYMVQVSSQRSEADAQAAYRSLQSKYPSVLGSRSASFRRADLGDKGIYYRAMVGPFAAAEDAGQLCSSLRSAGGQCVVQRN